MELQQTTETSPTKPGSFYIGNYADDAKNGGHKGWIVGAFMEEEPRLTSVMEVKYWEFAEGSVMHDMKISQTYEFTMIIEGAVKGQVNGQEITLRQGEYIVIPPRTLNNLVIAVLKSVKGVTIKAPSDPTAKMVVSA